MLPEYGDKVLELLKSPNAPSPDAAFLRALLGMAQLSLGKSNKEVVKKDLRAAITELSKHRATYGETVRWLDLRFTVLRDIVSRELDDGHLKHELEAVSAWLSKSYSGGQIAAYLGAAPLEGSGWHDALAQKKLLGRNSPPLRGAPRCSR